MLNKLTEIIQSPGKSLVATIGGTITGYLPTAVNDVVEVTNTNLDVMFQYTVWTITILVGITSLITWIQKQLRFYRKLLLMKQRTIQNNVKQEDNYECLNELIKEENSL